MSDETRDTTACALYSEQLLGLALGTIEGRDRARVLHHLERCQPCRTELDSLATVVDAMLVLAPNVEPPLGFESRLLERRERANAEWRSARRRRAPWFVAAALLLGIVGFGVGTHVHFAKNSPPVTASATSVARLTSHGRVVGRVVVSSGHPSWIYMTLENLRWSGPTACQVTLADGKIETVGHYTITDGAGEWGAPLKSGAGHVRIAQLVEKNGDVVARATFRA